MTIKPKVKYGLGCLLACSLWAVATYAADRPPGALGIEFVSVPAGCYMMGTDKGEKHELPIRKVCVSAFDIGKYEVTQGQWKALMGGNPSRNSACGDNCPVEQVSWNQAQAFITALNGRKEGVYRLPTEAEWEYACRSGGKDHMFAGGVDAADIDRVAWRKESSNDHSHPVGRKDPNELGAHDMSGNVWEWVQDMFSSPYSKDLPETNPVLNAKGEKRVLRGGSFDGKTNYVRCMIRNRNEADRQDRRLGFRLVREIPSP